MKPAIFPVFFFCIFLVLFSPLVFAGKSIFSDDIRSGYSVDVDDDFTFIMTMNKQANQLFVNGGSIFQSVPIFSCKDLGKVYEVCFYNTTFDESDEVLLAQVEIFRRKPDISITKTLNTTEVAIGKEVLVTLTIKNTGDPASQVTLLDEYPQSILISDIEGPGCMEHENTITWSGHLNTDVEKTCNFIIRGTQEMHRSIVAKVTYWNGLKWVTEYSARTTIDIEPSLKVSHSFVHESFEVDGQVFDFDAEVPDVFIGESPRLIIKVERDVPEKIYIKSFKVTFPSYLSYASTSNLRFNYLNATGDRSVKVWSSDSVKKLSSDTVEWKRDLESNSTERYLVLKFKATGSANHNILVDIDYEVGDDRIKGSFHDAFPVKVVDPGIRVTASFDDNSELFSAAKRLIDEDDSVDVQSSHPYRLTVYAQNKNPYANLRSVRFWTETLLGNFSSKSYPSILAEKQVIPWSVAFIYPEVLSDVTLPFNISVSYINEFGESGFNSTEWDVLVKGFSPVTIEHDSSEGFLLESKEKSFFSVSLQNDRVADVRNVFVNEVVADNFDVVGVTSNRLKLGRDEKSVVYKYEITAPVVRERTFLNITTFVEYFDNNLNREFNYSKTSEFTIVPREPDIDLTLTLEEPDKIYPGSLIPAMIEIANNDETELMRDITVSFPVSRDIDLLGPRNFFIPRLEPGEHIQIKNIVRLRPKVQGTLTVAPLVVKYSDAYGTEYSRNISDKTVVVEHGLISGPAVFIVPIVPQIGNVSTSLPLSYEIRNLGNAVAVTKMIIDGKFHEFSIPPGGLRKIPMDMSYDVEGEYSLPSVDAQVDYYGKELHTSIAETFFRVELLAGDVEVVMEADELPDVQAAPEPISIEEFEEALLREDKPSSRRSLVFLMILGAVGLLVIVGYIFYQKGKKGSSDIFFE